MSESMNKKFYFTFQSFHIDVSQVYLILASFSYHVISFLRHLNNNSSLYKMFYNIGSNKKKKKLNLYNLHK
jgi:hypothetical protein